MKKYIYAIIVISTLFAGCSQKTEYDIEEFGQMYVETQELFESQSEYLTDEEKFGEMGYELYKKCSKETGLPFNKQITLRGRKASEIFGFYVESTDGNYRVPCFCVDGDNSNLLVDDGDVIVVTGTFSEGKNSYGCLTSASIVSPKIDVTFNNNMTKVLSQALAETASFTNCYTIRGEVFSVLTLSEFEEYMALSMDNNGYEHSDYYYDHVITLTGKNSFISFPYNPQDFPNIEVGDEIATQGWFETTCSFNADETTTINWGFLGNVFSMYVYE